MSVSTTVLDGAASTTSVDAFEPLIARVSILGGHTQLDVGLPADIPIAALLPTLIERIQSRNPLVSNDSRIDDDDDTIGPLPDPRRWTLAPIGRDPLPTELSLHDAGVRDGDLLALRCIRVGDSPALFDDVLDALAELSNARFRHWTPDAARRVGHGVGLAAAALGATSLVAGHFVPQHGLYGWWPGLIAVIVGAGLLVSALLVRRYQSDVPTVAVLSWAALIFAAAGGASLNPGRFSSTTVVLSAATVLVVAVGSHRALGCSPTVHSAVTTVAMIVWPAALCQVFIGTPAQVAAVVAAISVGVVFTAPRMTAILAKLPLPSVPTAGDRLDIDEMATTPIEGIGAVGAITLPQVDSLAARAVVAQAYLTGISVGAGFVSAAAAAIAATPWSGFDTRACGYAAIIATVLVLRGRSHTDLVQAGALIVVGALSLLVVLAGLLTSGIAASPDRVLAVFGCAALIFSFAMIFGIVAPAHDFSPVARRLAELAEYLLVVAIMPLLCWLLDLYDSMRSLR
ncbi:type VII secretion integral membrane protein EccD [Gordonia sp. CPCC 205333]|uniref:type VII secretion integral membrane protein EccD n=1 Tax=Gordonia sp. CPCC 205333 TaxID=3140790 RepID=UPI003AF34FA8